MNEHGTPTDGGDLPAEVLSIRAPGAPPLGARTEGNLTRAQYLMWLGQSLNPGVPLYNMIQTFRIRGDLDPGLFDLAWQDTVDGADALRSTIVETDGTPHVRVAEAMDGAVTHVDLSAQPDPEAALEKWIEGRREAVLDIGRRWFDCALLTLGTDDHVWYLAIHHLATDGHSFELTYERTAEAYRRREAGDEPAPAGPTYAAHRDRVTAAAESQRVVRAREYWHERAAEAANPTSFYGRSVGGGARTVRHRVELGDETSTALRALASDERFQGLSEQLTLHAIWSAVLATTIHRVTGVDEVRLGTPFAARPKPVDRDTIGVFIEIGVLRATGADASFPELVEAYARELFGGLRHAVAGASSAELNRSYDVLINNVTSAMGPFAGRPTEVDWVHTGHGDPDHALRVQITDFNESGSYALFFDMNADVFDPERRGWFEAQFRTVLAAVLADPGRSVADFSLADAALVAHAVRFNDTEQPPPDVTVVDLVRAAATADPEAPAVIATGRVLSYAQLLERAETLAAILIENGVSPGERVALHLPRSAEAVVAMLATMMAGAAWVPVEVGDPAARRRTVLEEAGPAVVLGDAHGVAPPSTPVLDVDLDVPARVAPSFPALSLDDVAYLIFTSGSTGRPKGALLTHDGLQDYVHWAAGQYAGHQPKDFALHSSLAFDLTITSVFVPLVTGGAIRVYEPAAARSGLEVLDVFAADEVDVVKLTPAHLALVAEAGVTATRIKTLIVGGENFRTDIARAALDVVGRDAAIFNEYGPTEAVVGCMIHRFDPATDVDASVPIGTPAANARIHLVDRYDQPVPRGVVGEMLISGRCVALGYHDQPALTAERFGPDPFDPTRRVYRTGDLAYWDSEGHMVFLGRADDQVKIGGTRIELGDVEAALLAVDGVEAAVVDVVAPAPTVEIGHCTTCGLPSNYPTADFDDLGVCSDCRAYERHRVDVERYWQTPDDLHQVASALRAREAATYDCLVMLSGGKDSTYMLYQVVREFGLNPLVFTLDNGYISEGALENCRRATADLGVDLHVASTPHMNAIFVDSLERHSNVCNGCFKTIYTLSMDLAHEHGIDTIVTGLARGQLFETRLADTFRVREFEPDRIDDWIMEARKAYHHIDDAVYRLLDTSLSTDATAFDHIRYVDFYRYVDVPLSDVYAYLDEETVWQRPSDTGRSTNCLINDAGIFVHQRKEGFHNYALPYSWDVRLGHKTRDAAMHELDDDIDEQRVREILDEIGYAEDFDRRPREARLAAYVVGVDAVAVRARLAETLPASMVPTYIVEIDDLPLTRNGKVDRSALPDPTVGGTAVTARFEEPTGPVETLLAELWRDVFDRDAVGRHDNFFELGGDSIAAVQIVAMARREGVQLAARDVFDRQTIAELAHRTARVTQEAHGTDGAIEDPHVIAVVTEALGDDADHLEYAVECNPAQVGMLFHSLRDPEGGVYQQEVTATLPSATDLGLLEQAFGAAVDRHDALRSRFLWQGLQTPVQVVLRRGVDRFRLVLDPSEPTIVAPGRLGEANSFAVEVQRGDDELTLTVRSHHIALDGWSSQQILREVEVDYHRLSAGLAASDHQPRQIRDHAGWRRDREPSRGVAHYASLLADLPPKPMLPGLAPETVTHRPVREPRFLEPSLVERLQQVAASERLTVNTLIQGAWALALSRWTRSDDVVFGTTVAGRPEDLDGADEIVGMFIGTLPSRIVFPADERLLATFRALQATESAAREFADTSLAEVQHAVGARDALFDTLVVFESVPGRDASVPALFHDTAYVEQSNFPLALLVFPGEEIELRAVVNTERLTPKAAGQMLDATAAVLRQLADDPGLEPGAVRLLDPPAISDMWGRSTGVETAEAEPESLRDLFEPWFRSSPDTVAISGHARDVTWAELDRETARYGRAMIAAGVGPGSVVAVDATLSVESVIATVAAVRCGAAYVAIDPAQPTSRIDSILDESEVSVVVGDAPSGSRSVPRVVPDADDAAIDWPEVDPSDLAYVIFTSGSTGTPKGVPVRNEQIARSTRARSLAYDSPVERFLLVSPLAFDSSMVGLWWTLASGGTIVLRDPEARGDLRHTARRIAEVGVTDMLALPSLYSALLETAATDELASLRRVLVAGEACPSELIDRHRRQLANARLYNEYGPSEGTVWSHVARLDDRADGRAPIGRAIADTTGAVVDHHGALVPVGVPGELALAGPGVVDGYTAAGADGVFVDRLAGRPGPWYRTGDLVAMADDGDVTFLGRVDHQVKIRGQRVEIEEVEALLSAQPGVTGAGVRTVGAVGRERLVGFVTVDGDAAVDADDLRGAAADRLPAASVPSQIVVLSDLPTTNTGKLDRSRLPEVEPAQRAGVVAPRTELEERLAGLWRKILRVDSVSIDDDFFELGGDSLSALRLFADVSTLPGGDLPLSVLFDAPTIRSLAARIDQTDGPPEASAALVAIRPTGDQRPFFYAAPYDISVLELDKLARHFPADRPFYGLQPSGLAVGEAIHDTLEEMAAHYVAQVRTVQPQGPYAIGGHCDGGWIAYEMARQLSAVGEDVDYLGLVEIPPPYELRGRRTGVAYALRRSWYFLRDRRLFPAIAWQIRKRWEKRFWGTVAGGEQRRVAEVRAAAETAFRSYAFTYDYDGPSHFIQSTEGEAQPILRNWYETLAAPGEPVYEVVPSTHARLLMEPEVAAVADHLVTGLDAAETGGGS